MPDATHEQLVPNTAPVSRAVSVERYPTYAGPGMLGPQARSPLQAPYPSSDSLQHHANAFTGIVFTDDVQAETLHTYHANVKLGGRSSLVLDIGSTRNLAGERWIRKHAELAKDAGYGTRVTPRPSVLNVEGVGKEAEKCFEDAQVPCILETENGPMKVAFNAPIVPDSNLPALLGLTALQKLRAVIDCRTNEVHFLGHDHAPLGLPPGSSTVQAHQAPSGHLLLPCDAFRNYQRAPKKLDEQIISLATVQTSEE